MDYKEAMGYGKKKQPKKKNKVIESIKQELNEWSYTPPKTKRWKTPQK